jgi:hypothetical protein
MAILRSALLRSAPDLTYPFHDRDVLVTACGRICTYRKNIDLSTALAGRPVGIREVDDGIWTVSFMLRSSWKQEPCSPSTTPSARGRHLCLRYALSHGPRLDGSELDERALAPRAGIRPSLLTY